VEAKTLILQEYFGNNACLVRQYFTFKIHFELEASLTPSQLSGFSMFNTLGKRSCYDTGWWVKSVIFFPKKILI